MSKRKPNNMQARIARSCGALLRVHHVAVVNLDPSGRQRLINWKNCKSVSSRQVVDAMCDVPHRWTIYIAALCEAPSGEQYIKAEEVCPDGIHLADRLTDVIEHFYAEVKGQCNPNHCIGMAWLAIPDVVEVDKDQAGRVFDAVGAWNQQKVAA